MKAIFSSFALYRYLNQTPLSDDDNESYVSIGGNTFSVSGGKMKELDVTHKGEGTVNISPHKLRSLRGLLGEITDQPVTIEFSFDSITVTQIEI